MWEQIRYNQTRTAWLLAGMAVLLLVLSLAITIPVGGWLQRDVLERIVAGVLLASIIWISACLFAYFQGDDILLMLSKARRIRSLEHPRLYNIVEEMKIASGLVKMPSLYIVEDPAMNAFAVGCRPDKASIIVTSGLLRKLNRDELQGVVGHEIAHIVNRDVMLMSFCILLLDTITVMVWAMVRGPLPTENYESEIRGWRIMFWSLLVPTLVTILIIFTGGIGHLYPLIIVMYVIAFVISMPTVAQLVYYATSRRREYLADASSALFTRYPEGLASALEKMAASTNQVVDASFATAPIYIVNPFRSQGLPASDITSTHPSISERIRILRAMSHISYTEYDRVYREISGIDTSVIPASALVAADTMAIRAAVPEDLDHLQRTRETTHALWTARKYHIINCACGTKMRLPPSFRLSEVKCPHCGKTNLV